MDARVKPGHDAACVACPRIYRYFPCIARWHASHTFAGVAGISM